MAFYTGCTAHEPTRIHAVAVYCSDGRFGDSCEDFLHSGLRVPPFDRVTLPGGPVRLLVDGPSRPDSSAAWEALMFLGEVHDLRRVVLIAHEGCAYYLRRLAVRPEPMEARQRHDLVRAAASIQWAVPHVETDAFFARVSGDRVTFERVATHPPACRCTPGSDHEAISNFQQGVST